MTLHQRLSFAFAFAVLVVPHAAQATSPMVPPEMVAACKGKAEGEACVFAMSGKQISGLCAPLPEQSLACRPGGKPKAAKPAPK